LGYVLSSRDEQNPGVAVWRFLPGVGVESCMESSFKIKTKNDCSVNCEFAVVTLVTQIFKSLESD